METNRKVIHTYNDPTNGVAVEVEVLQDGELEISVPTSIVGDVTAIGATGIAGPTGVAGATGKTGMTGAFGATGSINIALNDPTAGQIASGTWAVWQATGAAGAVTLWANLAGTLTSVELA